MIVSSSSSFYDLTIYDSLRMLFISFNIRPCSTHLTVAFCFEPHQVTEIVGRNLVIVARWSEALNEASIGNKIPPKGKLVQDGS
jgi:hypothetical protein